jgi:hypothetical protein
MSGRPGTDMARNADIASVSCPNFGMLRVKPERTDILPETAVLDPSVLARGVDHVR